MNNVQPQIVVVKRTKRQKKLRNIFNDFYVSKTDN